MRCDAALGLARGCRDLVDVFQLPKPTQARSGGLRFHLPSSIFHRSIRSTAAPASGWTGRPPGCPDASPPQRIETRSKHGHGQLLRHCAWWHCVYTGTGQKEAWIADRLRGGAVLLVRCRGTKGAGGARKYSVLGPRISVTPKVPPFHDWRTPRIPGSTRHVYEWFYNKF